MSMAILESFTKSFSVISETHKYLRKAGSSDHDIQQLKQQWAQETLQSLRVDLEIKGSVSDLPALLLIGNHISYLDIPVLLRANPRISFVAKKEIQSWPVFGAAAERIETVFVERGNGSSRQRARAAVHQGLDQGRQVVIFPSGTTCLDESKMWKKGAFEIACERKSWIQPFRISYSPLRPAAYIDRDFFPFHLMQLAGLGKIQAVLEFHEPVQVTDPLESCLRWQYWSRGLLDS